MTTTTHARSTLILVLSLFLFLQDAIAQESEVVSKWHRVERNSLHGKVMVGYQGWFNTPNDGMKLGWKHWSDKLHQPLAPGNVTVDLWPDVSEFDADEKHATKFQHADGSPAYVFSSANRKTVSRHFQWMHDYGIDGAFLQRFGNGLAPGRLRQNKNRVLDNVKSAAEKNGRLFAVMYDLSGMKPGSLMQVHQDWLKIRKEFQLTQSNAYLHHHGKPLVAIWGVGFKSRHAEGGYSLQECESLVAEMKASGCCLMLGIPTGWREQNMDCVQDKTLHGILRQADILSPWTVGRYRNPAEVKRHRAVWWEPDQQWCKANQLEYMPVLFPGFSWHNLKHGKAPLDQIPRLKGKFLQSQIDESIQANSQMLYIAMFDEVDEGTAIFKCTNQPPISNQNKFLSYDGLPSDHYLKLVGQAGDQLRQSIQQRQSNQSEKR